MGTGQDVSGETPLEVPLNDAAVDGRWDEGANPSRQRGCLRLEEAVDGGEPSPEGSYRLERGGDRRVAGEGLAICVATLTLPPRLLTEDFFYHGVACGPS